MHTIVTLGAAYSANKGAASMVQALVDQLPKTIGPARLVAVSTHPAADRRAYARAGVDVEVASQRPVELAAAHFPLALLAGALRAARLPWRWVCRPAALRAYTRADVVADLSGISFVDGRRFPVLVYNALVVLVPLLLGCPVVKCSQALGDFTHPVNKCLAKLVLPKLAAVCPRGAATERHLAALGLTNVAPAADLAFTMDVPDEVRTRMRERLAEQAEPPYLVVAPSQVVDTYCQAKGIPYRTIMASYLDSVREQTGRTAVVIAHSAQPDAGVNHMNDLPLCREIHGMLARPEEVVFLDDDLLPTELRAVIAEADALVTSRFHAMISALTEKTPLLVIGWSHKYAEVLAPFELDDAALAYSDLRDVDAVMAPTQQVLDHADEVREKIARHLPDAVAESEKNFEVLAEAMPAGERSAAAC